MGICSLTNVFEKAMIYPVIALWKLEKPIVRKAPEGAFRYFREKFTDLMEGCGKIEEKAIFNL